MRPRSFVDVRLARTVVCLLSNNLSGFNNLSDDAVNNFCSAVNNFLDNCAVAASSAIALLRSLSLTAASSERESHSGYEHKCNLFHFLFCFLIL